MLLVILLLLLLNERVGELAHQTLEFEKVQTWVDEEKKGLRQLSFSAFLLRRTFVEDHPTFRFQSLSQDERLLVETVVHVAE